MELVSAIVAVMFLFAAFLNFCNAMTSLNIHDNLLRAGVGCLLNAAMGSAFAGLAFLMLVSLAKSVT